MSSRTNTFILLGIIALACISIGIGIFYFLFHIPEETLPVSEERSFSQETVTNSPIHVFKPRIHERVDSPTFIQGETTLPQRAIHYRLKNESGEILSSGYVGVEKTQSQTNTFEGSLTYTATEGGTGFIEVFVVSDSTAQEESLISVPVFYTETLETIERKNPASS